MTVISAFGLDQKLPSGGGAREPRGAHRGFRARAVEAHHLDRGEEPGHPLGQADLGLGRRAVGGAAADRARERPIDERRLVSEQMRPVGHHVVDVEPAVHVPEARPPARDDEERLAFHRPERADGRGDPSRHELLRAFVEGGGAVAFPAAARSFEVQRSTISSLPF